MWLRRRRWRWGGTVTLLLGCLVGGVVSAQADDEVDTLVRGGATQLALQVHETREPSTADMVEWMAWERRRLDLLARQGEWDVVAERPDTLPPEIPLVFRQEVQTLAADAWLRLGDGAAARALLRRMLWDRGSSSSSQRDSWRRLIVRSYLVDDRLVDATIAMMRYEREFLPADAEWTQLHARILIQNGETVRAAALLSGVTSAEGRLLRLLARLRSGEFAPEDVAVDTRRLLEGGADHERLRAAAWMVLAEAEEGAGNRIPQIVALERALAEDLPQSLAGLFHYNVDTLWGAYESLARSAGNERNLLLGVDEPWLGLAEADSDLPASASAVVSARAVNALLSVHGGDSAARFDAQRRLSRQLRDAGHGRVLTRLYTESERYPDTESIPVGMRYILSDHALTSGDVRLAAELVAGLETPPPDMSHSDWVLRRARLAIYAGEFDRGESLLDGLLAADEELDPESADRTLQVLFDLQAVGRNTEALALLDRLRMRMTGSEQRRQIWYWMADSAAADEDHVRAAQLYLRSATHGSDGSDPWGQSSRYRAAEMLSKAGLADDARTIYQGLLAETADANRRAVLEQRIQQLWLIEAKE